MLHKLLLLYTIIIINLIGIHINTCVSLERKKPTCLYFLKDISCQRSKSNWKNQERTNINLKIEENWNFNKENKYSFLNNSTTFKKNYFKKKHFKKKQFRTKLFITSIEKPYEHFQWDKEVFVETDINENNRKNIIFFKERRKCNRLFNIYEKHSNLEIGRNISNNINRNNNLNNKENGIIEPNKIVKVDGNRKNEIYQEKKEGNDIYKYKSLGKNKNDIVKQESTYKTNAIKSKTYEQNTFYNMNYLKHRNEIESINNSFSIDENNVGKIFYGIVYSVNENTAYIKINELNKFGLLYKNKANLGSDAIDMKYYFKENQQVCVKILGINQKRKFYYLGNVIKYNKNIILKIGDYSKGLITKLSDQYCFIKILKNGSIGYLHKSKLLMQKKTNELNNSNSHITNLSTHSSNETNNDIKNVETYKMDLLTHFKFRDIFKIWDIIDIEIYEEAGNKFKSQFILTIQKNTETYKKVQNHLELLNKKFMSNEENQENQYTHIEKMKNFNSNELNILNDLKGINSPIIENKNYVLRKKKIIAGERRDRQQKENILIDTSKNQKKGKRIKKKTKIVYQLNEGITLFEFAKLTKNSLSSIKKFFIINYNEEFNSNFQLSKEQIEKLCSYFGLEYDIQMKNCYMLEDSINTEKEKLASKVNMNHNTITEVKTEEESVENIKDKDYETNKSYTDICLEQVNSSQKINKLEQTKANFLLFDKDSKNLGKKKISKDEKKDNTKYTNLLDYDTTHDSNKRRNAVVTFLGHINHGKTSLFDILCKTNERTKEFGLITQNIRAVKTKLKNEYTITFIDTPGHAAFMAIRNRGIQVADLSILVISAEEGIQEQTVECIKLIKQFQIKFLIAITKIDMPNTYTNRIINDLLSYDIVTELNGGDVQVIEVSIFDESSINNLLDAISLETDFLNLYTNEKEKTSGIILDAYMDNRYGIVSINLIQNGIIKINDWFYAGSSFGKIKFIKDSFNKNVKVAYSSDPVKIIGYNKYAFPKAGEKFYIVNSEQIAKENAGYNKLEILVNKLNDSSYDSLWNDYEHLMSEQSTNTSENIKTETAMYTNKEQIIDDDKVQELTDKDKDKDKNKDMDKDKNKNKENIIYEQSESIKKKKKKKIYIHFYIKCDKQGTLEVLNDAILKIKKEDYIYSIENKIIYKNVGDITKNDINYAISLNAIIIGFNVLFSKSVSKSVIKGAKNNKNVKFIFSNVLYELIKDIEIEMEKRLGAKPSGNVTGTAIIVKVFNISKLGKVAGCVVTSGIITINSNVRIIRDDKVIYIGKIISLKIVKEEKKQVIEKDECGMGIENFTDFQIQDIIEAYSE